MIEYTASSLYIKGSVLWLDAVTKKELSFVSHVDKLFVPHTRIIATKETIAYYKKFFLKNEPLNALQMSFFRKFSIGGLTISLYPSGYSYGAAQILVKKDNKKILYSGSINNRQLYYCDEIYYPSADILIMESVYGMKKYNFSGYKQEEERLKNYVNFELKKGNNVAIFISPFEKPQYLIKIFNEFKNPIYLQSKIYQYINHLKDYIKDLRTVRAFVTSIKKPSIILYPESLYQKFPIKENTKKIMVTGRAIEPEKLKSRYNLDETFVISAHADFNSLVQYAELVNPTKIYLMPSENGNEELADTLRNKKFIVDIFSKPIPKKLF